MAKKTTANRKPAPGKSKGIFRSGWLKLVLRILKLAFIFFVVSSVLAVILFRFINPPVTFLMIERGFERKSDG